MRATISLWTKASRPQTLGATVCPILLGMALAWGKGVFEGATLFFTLVSALAIQIGTNWANDYFDLIKGADTSARKGPVRVTQAGLVSHAAIKRAFILAFTVAALAGCFLIWKGGLYIWIFLPISIVLGLLYTAGPYPLAYLGLGDVFVLAFFGPLAVAGTYFLQTNEIWLDAFLVGLAPGCFSWAILLINNLRDVEEDRAAKKMTLCVRGGVKFGKTLFAVAIATPLFLPLLWMKEHPLALLASSTVFLAGPLLKDVITNQDPFAFNGMFKRTGQLMLLYSLLFATGWLL